MAELAAELRSFVSEYDEKFGPRWIWPAAHAGASRITWLLARRGDAYLIVHQMESQVYLEDGLRQGSALAPDDEPHHEPGR